MADQLATGAEALRLFFTEDIFLVESNEPAENVPQPEVKPAARVFSYLGKNQKNVLILVNDEGNDVSTESGRELLRNLVKALQLTANDFALMNFAGYEQLQFAELHSFFSCRLVLAFGVLPSQLGIADQPQHMISTQESIQFVFSGNLHQLSSDLEGKKKLWGSLKQIRI